MADDFHVCNENWWSVARSSSAGFDGPTGMSSVASSISCSSTISHISGGGGYSWAPAEVVEGSTRSAGDEPVGSGSGSTVSYQDSHKVQASDQVPPCVSFMDSSLQVPGFGLSSPMIDWNQALIGSGRVEPSFHAMLQEDLSSRAVFRQGIPMESAQAQGQGSTGGSSANLFKEMNQGLILLEQQHQEQGQGGNFPLVPTSYGYNSVAQGLYEQENKSQQQQSLFQSPMVFQHTDLPQFLKSSSPKHHALSNQLHFSNNTPYWNASGGTAGVDVRPSFYASLPSHFVQQAFEQKPNCNNNLSIKNSEAVTSGTRKSNSEPAFKKPRMETPSPLPTFKVRKEKLGDRITALQQLVSPFGKTDTASVLHEAIDYIKFLHEQVGVLSTPYLKNGNLVQHQQNNEKHKDGEGSKQDLRSRGLCLVPISSTFPVASETPADFWTPTFGGMYR
ncbi:transcription factor bHLH112-like isoform X2 [Dioscorea cayenensis subsp. rotundata]|uniref:Transcription factor bHLH112-like isoform X2 n=1 Tax=Dioscorea cayennensis subsp. rotundata TaxID=55577 RepID=A0AB40BVU3_DIOCR|nr:transcription factor bHLH112-like isoform X2 [Dioscorea cayenensis subsp. rotundata]